MLNLLKKISLKIAYKLWNEDDVIFMLRDKFKEITPIRNNLAYKTDGLYTVHNSDFINEPLFKQSYQLGKETGSWGSSDVHWRAYICCWAAQQVKNLEGDFVECGVNRGGLSRAVINYVDFSKLGKKFFLMDTFNGLDETFVSETEKKSGMTNETYGYTECYEDVKKTFSNFNVEIIRGSIPETLSQAKVNKVCYLSIDMNCVEPEIAAANYFWNHLVAGAIIILDDYGWPGHIEQKLAFDAFAKEKGCSILSLPTGQGLIIKKGN